MKWLLPAAAVLLALSWPSTEAQDLRSLFGLECPRAGYMYPDPNDLCFVWFCTEANRPAIKRACPKGVRVPSWWQGGMLNMCYVVNIVKHGGEPSCLRCDIEDERQDENCANNLCDDECTCLDTEHTYRCVCPYIAGVFRNNAIVSIPNHCETNSCENGGTCQNQWDGFFCFCPNGWTGHRCEVSICDWHPCLNGGTCVIDEIGYHCECGLCHTGSCCQTELQVCGLVCSTPCATGPACDVIADTCECNPPSSCNGPCRDTPQGPQCDCFDKCYKGPFCRILIDSCECNNNCANNSRCENTVIAGNGETSHECECNECFSGPNCSPIISCDCHSPCGPNEFCNMVNGEPTCGCSDSCYLGSSCDQLKNNCECNNPCGSNGQCLNGPNGPICDCNTCYEGSTCQQSITSCDCNSPCNEYQECTMQGNNPVCRCRDCFEGARCDQPIDSCACNNPCDNEATCKDGPNGAYCECDCVGDEICAEKLDGSRVCECPPCTENSRGSNRGCGYEVQYLCECYNPCTEDQQVCVNAERPNLPTCEIGNPSSGNAFTIVFEENETERSIRQIPLELYFTPSVPNSGTRFVNIRSAKLDRSHSCYFNVNFTIPENDVYRYTVERCMMHNNTGLSNLAIKAVELNKKTMIVYGINKDRWTADAFLAIPDTMAGQHYQTTSYAPAHIATQFNVVALRDNTEVTIELADDNDLRVPFNTAGSTYSLTMDAFQTFQVQARCRYSADTKKRQCPKDLSGSVIRSDKPIHVFSGNVRAFIQAGEGTSRDHLIEQLTSVDKWGKMFAFVSVPGRVVGDVISVMSIKGTPTIVRLYSVDENDQEEVMSFSLPLSGGRTNRYIEVPSSARYYIEANNPLMVVQLTKSKDTYLYRNESVHDPVSITVPPVEQFTDNFFVSTPQFTGGRDFNLQPYNTSLAMMVVPSGSEGSIRLNGRPLVGSDFLLPWGPIPHSDLMGGAIKISHGTHLIDSATQTNFQCLMYGYDDRESYGFPAAMNLASIVVVPETK